MANLHFFYGPIASGKSVKLIQDRYNLVQKGIKVLVIKPKGSIDSESKIKSRIGVECPAEIYTSIDWTDFVRMKDSPDVIMVNEVHLFTPNDIDNLVKLADSYNKLIFCYGLLVDTNEHMFPASKHLLEVGAKSQEIKVTCQNNGCKNLANHNVAYDEYDKIIRDSRIILDSKNVTYKSLCRQCYDRIMQKHR